MTEKKRIELSLNVKAPIFNEKDAFDRPINLEDYKGKKVFIAFFRHAGCPFCNLRVHYLQKKHQELKEKGLEMIFFFESTKRVMLTSSFHREVSPIPLIPNPDKSWYETYGIEQSKTKSKSSHLTGFITTTIKAGLKGLPMHMPKSEESLSTMPAEFLLDENLIIRKLHYSQGLNDRMSIQHLYDFAEGK